MEIYSARSASKYANKTRTKFSGGRHSEYENTSLLPPPHGKVHSLKNKKYKEYLENKKNALRCVYSARNASKYANKTRTKFSGGRHSEYKNTSLIQPPNGGKKLF